MNELKAVTPEEKQEKPISREQRRSIERAQKIAKQTYETIAGRFLTFLVNSEDISEQAITDKIAQLNQQWRFYCKSHQLGESAFPVIEEYCAQALKEFNESK